MGAHSLASGHARRLRGHHNVEDLGNEELSRKRRRSRRSEEVEEGGVGVKRSIQLEKKQWVVVMKGCGEEE